MTFSSWINPHYWMPPHDSVYRALVAMGEPYLWRMANKSCRTCVVVKQIQSNPICLTVIKQMQSNLICLTVRQSVCLSQFYHYVSLTKSSINFRSYYQWQKWCPCKRSRSEFKGYGYWGQIQCGRLQTETPLRPHIWWSKGEVPNIFSRLSVKFQGNMVEKSSNLTLIMGFRTITPVLINQWLRNEALRLK